MELTKRRADAIRKVITENYHPFDRIKILTKRGYNVKRTLVNGGGKGTIHIFPRSAKLQIASADSFYRAYCVIFDPSTSKKISELNRNK